MKGLAVWVVGLMLVGRVALGLEAGFSLPTHPEEDWDLFLAQKCCLSLMGEDLRCTVTVSDEGEVQVSGEERELLEKFAKRLETPFKEKRFEERKERYLSTVQEGDQKRRLENLTWDDLLLAQESLLPLNKVFRSQSMVLLSAGSNVEFYYELPMSEDQQNTAYKLIYKMGNTGYWELFKNRKEMDKMGDKLACVHPLRFIGYLYGHPHLKKCMSKILDDTLIRRGFLNGHGKREGFAHRMTKEANKGNLMRYVPGFAQSLGIQASAIEPFFHRHDWEGLLHHLCH